MPNKNPQSEALLEPTVSEILSQFESAFALENAHSHPIPVRPVSSEEKAVYQLPFVGKALSHSALFDQQADNPVFLRPADIERFYGIPASTVYDWIHNQAETHFPTVKLVVKEEGKRRMVLIPKRLLDEWIIDHSTIGKQS